MKGIGAWVVLALGALVAVAIGTGCGSAEGSETIDHLPASPAGKAEVANFDGVHSGEIQLVAQVRRLGKHPETANIRIVGPFMKAGEEPLPQMDPAIESNGELAGHTLGFLSGPLLRDDKWVVNFAGKVYEPDHASFVEMKSKFEEAQNEEGGEGNAMACVEAAEGFDITDVVHGVSFEGNGETLDGTKVATVGGDLDPSAVIDQLIELGEESPGCRSQLEAVGVPPPAGLRELEQELEGSLASAQLTVSLDKHGLMRSGKVLVAIEEPGSDELEVEVTLQLNQVNEVTQLPITHGYSPYPALLKQFGLNRQDVKEAGAGEIYVGVLGTLAARLLGQKR